MDLLGEPNLCLKCFNLKQEPWYRVPKNPKDSTFPNRVIENLLGIISSTGIMKTMQDIFVQGHHFFERSDKFYFVDCKTLHFTVSSTMDELYRMDHILEMQGNHL